MQVSAVFTNFLSFSVYFRAITLDNQLVVLGTTAADAGRYYVQAVNERNGENKSSPSIYLSIASKSMQTFHKNVCSFILHDFIIRDL